MGYTDSDVKAIVDTKTEQLQKEISLLKEEYQVLKVTSEQIEEDQARRIYELQQRIEKALSDLNIIIDTIKQQPLENNHWILERLEANKNILEEE